MSTFAVCFNRFYDMPYIRIKAYPKDQATKEKVVEAINKVFVGIFDHKGTAKKMGVLGYAFCQLSEVVNHPSFTKRHDYY